MAGRELAFYLNAAGLHRRTILGHLARADVRLIGVDGCPWDVDRDRAEIDRFVADVEALDMRITSMHGLPPILATADADPPSDLLERQRHDLRRMALLGGSTAVYHACWMRDVRPERFDAAIAAVGWPAFVDRYARALGRLAREAAEVGITIVLENVWHSTHAAAVAGFVDVLRAVEEPNVGICLDSGHAHLAGRSVADEIRAAGPILKDTHFHDNVGPICGEPVDQHLPPGLGAIDWQDVCLALDEIAYPGPIVFEGVLGPGDSVAEGRFGGKLSHRDLITITIANWRAFEALAERRATECA